MIEATQAEVFQTEAFPRWGVRWKTPAMPSALVSYFNTQKEAEAARARLVREVRTVEVGAGIGQSEETAHGGSTRSRN